MPLRRQKPRRWTPAGLTDAVDGSDSFPGAMALLTNLIAQPNTKGIMVPRPAMTPLIAIPDFASGPVTAEVSYGNTFYGMAASVAFPGKDRPFLYNATANTFTTITGLSSALLPTSQPTTGDWTPPTIAYVASRVVFTHPGFPGGMSIPPYYNQFVANTNLNSPVLHLAETVLIVTLVVGMIISGPGIPVGSTVVSINVDGLAVTISNNATATAAGVLLTALSPTTIKFGWLDISSLTVTTMANVTSGLTVLTGNPSLTGVQPGMTITGTNISTGTVVQSAALVTIVAANCTLASSSPNVTLSDTEYPGGVVAVGQQVSGSGIPLGTTVTSVSGLNIVISQNATLTGSSTLTFSGAFIIMSLTATGTATGINITIAGGTPAAPLWGAGDLNTNPIGGTAPAVFVSQFNNRAWFGVNTPTTAGVQASDAGAAAVQTNISQTLTFFDGVPVTAGAGLALFNQLGGVVQSLMVFQGDSNIRQITGDFSTGTIAVNSLQTATGTLAPNSIEPTPKGLLFMASDGLRIIDFDARVSDPIGVRGHGISLPFINAVTPTRAEASFNENIYRITVIWQPPVAVQSVWGTAQRTDEFWYHLDLDKWSGPHTSRCDNLAPWPGGSSFVTAPSGARGFLYRSDPEPNTSSSYTEFGTALSCTAQTVLLPDNPEGMAHSVVESTVFIGLVSGSENILVTAKDDAGQVLDVTYVWIGPFLPPSQRAILWHAPLVFRQMSLLFQMGATPALQLGSIMIRDQELGYQLVYPAPVEFILDSSVLGGPDVLGP